MQLQGEFQAIFSCKDARVRFHLSDHVSEVYLSLSALHSLRMVHADFPTPQCAAAASGRPEGCECLERVKPPPKPQALPFDATQEDESLAAPALRRVHLQQMHPCPLPEMDGPPLEIHLKEGAVPKKITNPAAIPGHWGNAEKEQLNEDERLGVIEKVTEPSAWCHRMVVVKKPNGSPRRTVDLQPLNRWCKREEFIMESPAIQVKKIPRNSWKTVVDAWNGYHSVPIRECDRHLTTFITPYGRYRYIRNIQGFVGAGDGYNRRFDDILSDFKDGVRVVDDAAYWGGDLTAHWWRTIELLDTVGRAGIVLNPDKFQFCQSTVDFAGFQVTPTSVRPLAKYMDAIKKFPMPKNISDIRAWFGLVNQVANYGQLRKYMASIRHLLSPKTKFEWNAEIDAAFNSSKALIVEAIKDGVEIFEYGRRTCLRTDWSKTGIGYFLQQKHCACALPKGGVPTCCDTGWRIVLAGSRFLSAAEKNVAVEGEALAIAWSLEQTKYFTMGCPDLVVVMDHKPLVRLLGPKAIEDVANPRLFRLKQRVAMWDFQMAHLPSRSNSAADATSRQPSTADNEKEQTEELITDTTCSAISLGPQELHDAAAADPAYQRLRAAVDEDFPNWARHDPTTSRFWSMKDSM